jgi:hypothetical protein
MRPARSPSRIPLPLRPSCATADRPAVISRRALRELSMQDILWIGAILALLAASLGYAALCDNQ